MTDNIPVREATSGDLIKLRSTGQWGKLNLAIQHAATGLLVHAAPLLAV